MVGWGGDGQQRQAAHSRGSLKAEATQPQGSPLTPHLLLGQLLVGKEFVNVPVVLEVPGKTAVMQFAALQPHTHGHAAQHSLGPTAQLSSAKLGRGTQPWNSTGHSTWGQNSALKEQDTMQLSLFSLGTYDSWCGAPQYPRSPAPAQQSIRPSTQPASRWMPQQQAKSTAEENLT